MKKNVSLAKLSNLMIVYEQSEESIAAQTRMTYALDLSRFDAIFKEHSAETSDSSNVEQTIQQMREKRSEEIDEYCRGLIDASTTPERLARQIAGSFSFISFEGSTMIVLAQAAKPNASVVDSVMSNEDAARLLFEAYDSAYFSNQPMSSVSVSKTLGLTPLV